MEYLNNRRNRAEMSRNAKYTINAQCKIYMNSPKKTLKGYFAKIQGGLSRTSPLRSHGSRDNQMGGWTSRELPEALKTKLAQGGHQAQVNSDQ
jgi:hypothetical protein